MLKPNILTASDCVCYPVLCLGPKIPYLSPTLAVKQPSHQLWVAAMPLAAFSAVCKKATSWLSSVTLKKSFLWALRHPFRIIQTAYIMGFASFRRGLLRFEML